eukprot:TRINITY_DN388_c0_g1_i1.p1 TRINITY_DN388_c0_g1~~TRINITY_DN388_c0_g1_i1.p1  ORF type:complete len:658 (+),score=214.81 TRINITY_DN388_c0_g1_i1:96-1976(+)
MQRYARTASAAQTLRGRRWAGSSEATLMSNSEAFVETLASRGVDTVFGIVGSAFMDALDLFPAAGIRFLSVQHEQGAAHMADGYARVTGKHGVCIAQNGPGITNFVTGVAAAYYTGSPVVAITPEAATSTKGLGGFQEVEQLPIFETITKEQVHVVHPARMAELTGYAFDSAVREGGPIQLNIPRDYFYGENKVKIPKINIPELSAGGERGIEEAARLVEGASNPVMVVGGGVVMSETGFAAARELADYLQVPVATTYLHNDAFDKRSPLWCGPLGYCGHKTAMNCVKEADVVLAIGTRLGPFGTNPQYGMDYWPEGAKVVQVDVDAKKVGRVKEVDVGVCGDAGLFCTALLKRLQAGTAAPPFQQNTKSRLARMEEHRAAWTTELEAMAEANVEACETSGGRLVPRKVLWELEKAMPRDAIVATDIGNTCSVSNGYLRFEQPRSYLAALTFGNCGYAFPAAMGAKVGCPERPAVAYVGDGAFGMSLMELLTCAREGIPTTVVTFNNQQWGAEKKNQVLWFGDRYVGTNLVNPETGFAGIAEAMGCRGITVSSLDQVGDALRSAVDSQMKDGVTTVIDVHTTRELGDPFRRDAMKLPQRILPKYRDYSEVAESSTGQPVDLLKRVV